MNKLIIYARMDRCVVCARIDRTIADQTPTKLSSQRASAPTSRKADIYANGSDCQLPATNSSLVTTKLVPDGWEISGRAAWGTGIMHADWVLVSGATEDGILCFLVPASDVGFDDVWHMSGMSATGSNDIIIDECLRAGTPHPASASPDHWRRSINEMMNRAGATNFRTDAVLQRLPVAPIQLQIDRTIVFMA